MTGEAIGARLVSRALGEPEPLGPDRPWTSRPRPAVRPLVVPCDSL